MFPLILPFLMYFVYPVEFTIGQTVAMMCLVTCLRLAIPASISSIEFWSTSYRAIEHHGLGTYVCRLHRLSHVNQFSVHLTAAGWPTRTPIVLQPRPSSSYPTPCPPSSASYTYMPTFAQFSCSDPLPTYITSDRHGDIWPYESSTFPKYLNPPSFHYQQGSSVLHFPPRTQPQYESAISAYTTTSDTSSDPATSIYHTIGAPFPIFSIQLLLPSPASRCLSPRRPSNILGRNKQVANVASLPLLATATPHTWGTLLTTRLLRHRSTYSHYRLPAPSPSILLSNRTPQKQPTVHFNPARTTPLSLRPVQPSLVSMRPLTKCIPIRRYTCISSTFIISIPHIRNMSTGNLKVKSPMVCLWLTYLTSKRTITFMPRLDNPSRLLGHPPASMSAIQPSQ